MSAASPLDEWGFLIGDWKSKAEKGQFDEKGTIEGSATFSYEPGEMFIMGIGENRSEGQLLNKSVSVLFYDGVTKKFRRKTFFSYGFVNNEVEYRRTKSEIRFEIVMEPLPKQFEGTKWRSFIRRISDTKIAMGLETSRNGKEFKPYGESMLEKQE